MRWGRIAMCVALVGSCASLGVASSRSADAAGAHVARLVERARPAAASAHHPDFNGDGYADVVVTSQGDTVNGGTDSGGFWILYGGVHGANTGNVHRYFTEATIGRGATSVQNDAFGFAFIAVDFNGDGYDDLAVSAVDKTINGNANAGAVVVLYGSHYGLLTGNAQFFSEATSGMHATAEMHDYFGEFLAGGDFNHDGYADLAVGAPGKTVNGHTYAGAVYELFGTAHGLSHAAPLSPRTFTAATPGLHGGVGTNDYLGQYVTAADFNGDGFADLAAGQTGKTIGGHNYAGAVQILRGSPSGLTGTGAQTWTQDSTGMPDSSEDNDNWGGPFGAIDINGDGRSELLIGAPAEDQGATQNVGSATLLWGGPHGLSTTNAVEYLVSNTTFGQTPAGYDYFGSSFAPFDFDGDGRMDLAIGVEGRAVGGAARAGEVVVLHNVGGHLTRSGGFALDRNTAGMVGPAGPMQQFGALVRGGDWSGNGRDDLAVGLPDLTVSGKTIAGGMQIFYGTSSGLSTNDQFFTANTLGGTPYTDAWLGGYDY